MAITFPIFTPPPDFSRDIQRTLTTAQDVLRLSGAQALVTWPATRTETSFRMVFSIRGARAVQDAKAFLAARGGQHEAWFLPTWQRDFSLAIPATTGDTTIRVAVDDYAALYLTTTADDELGRFLFTYDTDNGLFTTRIIQATTAGSGASDLELEDALPWTPATGAIWGHLALVRMSDDQIAVKHMTPTHITFELAAITVRQRSTTDETLVLDRSTGPAGSEPFTSATIQAVDSPRLRHDYAHTLGPVNLHFPQDETFATPWAIWLGSQRVRMANGKVEGDIWPPDDAEGFPSDLFPDSKPNTTHISAAFDQNSWEVLAWENTAAETITIRRRFNGVIVEHVFPGRSPALFNDGIIAVQARLDGLSDVVCYYDRPGHNCIFARLQRDNYGVEYPVVLGPAKLRKMIDAGSEGFIGTIRFIDDSFRLVTLRTDEIPEVIVPPSPYIYGIFDEGAAMTTNINGEHRNVVVEPGQQPSEMACLMTELSASVDDTIVGTGSEERAALFALLTAANTPAILSTSGAERLGLATSLAAVYTFVVISAATTTENASLSYELRAVYS